MTPLCIAAHEGKLDCLEYLLAQPLVDATKCSASTGMNALHYACAKGRVEVMQFLLDSLLLDINAVDNEEKTALFHAAEAGAAECVMFLLFAPGIAINKPSRAGRTPYGVARSRDVKEMLEQAGGRDT
jgi:ankyrin repeat protein